MANGRLWEGCGPGMPGPYRAAVFLLGSLGKAAKPLRPRRLGQLPTAWGASLRGLCPRESLPTCGEVGKRSDARKGSARSRA